MIVHDKWLSRIVLPDATDEAVTLMELNDIKVLNVLEDKGKKTGGDVYPIRSIGDMSKGIVPSRSIDIGIHTINLVCPLGKRTRNPRRVKNVKNTRM